MGEEDVGERRERGRGEYLNLDGTAGHVSPLEILSYMYRNIKRKS